MVMDAFEVAGRIARLHGARNVQLLLVDSLRWDLGQMVKARLGGLLGARASLADEVLLWSALPTTTARQMDTLARGPEVLRCAGEREQETESLRGRTAEFVRRIRVGSRDVHKLDLVEARLREPGGDPRLVLGPVADTVAQVIVRHSEGLAPRTLLFVFGDHGFAFEKAPRSAEGPAVIVRQGGAWPEEVLVPGFALLIGAVH